MWFLVKESWSIYEVRWWLNRGKTFSWDEMQKFTGRDSGTLKLNKGFEWASGYFGK